MLRSNRLRIQILLAAFGALLLILVIRVAVVKDPLEAGVFPSASALLAAMIGFEALSLYLVKAAIRTETDLPRWSGLANLFIEALFPSIALLILTHSRLAGPYNALVTPAASIYFIFIILSVLRLTPLFCWLTGLTCTAGYLAVMVHTYSEFPSNGEFVGVFPVQTYLTFGGLILIAGFAAAGVARQIQEHVMAALREAETKREVERMQQDLEIARSIQQGLLPKDPPKVKGFDIAGWNRPADETGGDYFDWQELSGGRIAITLADVSGHGIGPALVMASCRAYSRACFPIDEDLSRVMGLMNRILSDDLPANRFITFAVARLDPDHSTASVVSAGHGPIVVFESIQGRFRIYDPQGIPLGLMPEAGYGAPHVIRMNPGDILCLVTDGFLEWNNPQGAEYGLDRLQGALRTLCDLQPDAMIQGLYQSVIDFAQGTEQQDDLTAVIVKRTAHANA